MSKSSLAAEPKSRSFAIPRLSQKSLMLRADGMTAALMSVSLPCFHFTIKFRIRLRNPPKSWG